MKRLFIILITALMTVSLSGCNNEGKAEEIVVTIVSDSIYDYEESISIVSESDIWTRENISSHIDEAAPETMNVEFNGKTYIGKYVSSRITGYNTYQTDEYDMGEGSFSVKSDTGELVEFVKPKEVYGELSKEEGLKIAHDIAREYISIDEYTLNVSLLEIGTYYYYEKYIDGIKVWDSLTIGISPDKEIIYFGRSGVGGVDTDTAVANYNISESQTAADKLGEKIDTIRQESSKEITYGIKRKTVVGLEDGKAGIVYTVELKHLSETGLNDYLSEGQLVDIMISAP